MRPRHKPNRLARTIAAEFRLSDQPWAAIEQLLTTNQRTGRQLGLHTLLLAGQSGAKEEVEDHKGKE